jgi:predicted phage tail protein
MVESDEADVGGEMDESQGYVMSEYQPDAAAQEYINSRVKAGASREAIVQELVQRGYSPHIAANMVGGISKKATVSARKSGLSSLIIGIIITVVFLGLTISSILSAYDTGGTYVVCYGMILFGISLTIRGVVQLIRGR